MEYSYQFRIYPNQIQENQADGNEYPNHKYLAKSEKKLARLQRQLSRKTKGSHRREKVRIKIARLHEHISNQRKDQLHKLSTERLRRYDIICIFYPSSQLCSSCGVQCLLA